MLVGRFPRGQGRRVPDHRHRGGPGEGARQHRRALRPRGAGHGCLARRTVGDLAHALAARRGRHLARARVDGVRRTCAAAPRPPSSPRSPRPRWERTTPSATSSPRASMPGSAPIDAVLTRDSNGHHGVSVGDADGDGLDDLYVAQPSGLPNRLYRARGDGTFEDATERAGLAVLDDTVAVPLRRRGQRRRPGPRPQPEHGADALFLNDGTGRFTARPRRVPLPARGSAGSPMSMAMADYDRDGFLDLYLCVYAFYYGAGEGKAGTPMPYYDARNGPPSVLFRNDGNGRFVDATHEAGPRGGQRPVPLRRRLGRLRRRRMARPAGRQRLRAQEPVPQPGSARREGDVRRRGRAGGRRGLRGRDERGLLRLRQRRPPRHLHRQHVERQRPAGDRAGRLHARGPRGGARALPPPCARQLPLPEPRRRRASRT